jgi:extracellular elastinolytic metalloproteinase
MPGPSVGFGAMDWQGVRGGLSGVTGLLLGAAALVPVSAADARQLPRPLPSFDSRDARPTDDIGPPMGRVPSASPREGPSAKLARSLGVEAVLQKDPLRGGGVRTLARLDGFLTGPSRDDPEKIALRYVRDHADVFGLDRGDLRGFRLVRSFSSSDGVTHLTWAQESRGVPTFDTGLKVNVTKDGRIVNVLGSPRPDLEAPGGGPRLSASAALRRAGGDVGVRLRGRRASGGDGPRRTTRFSGGHVARLTLFPSRSGVRLAWRVNLDASPVERYDYVIDAKSGAVLHRQNHVVTADGLAWDYFPGAPNGGTQQPRDFSIWGTEPGRLAGNNAHTWNDLNGDETLSPGEEVPPSDGVNWNYTFTPFFTGNCPPSGCAWDPSAPRSWEANRGQSATQAYYFINKMHDHLAAPPIGFGEAQGNFQQVNFSGRGQGGDAVEQWDLHGADTDSGLPLPQFKNNAFFGTNPDGQPGVMGIFLADATGGFFDVDFADSALVMYHEATHGMNSRTVTDTDGFGTLTGQGGAMDEAWADWFAIDFVVGDGLQADTGAPGEVSHDPWEAGGRNVTRTEPIDCPVGSGPPECPGSQRAGPGGYTYGDYARIIGIPEVHADGEIWGQTLWDLRSRLIADHGVADGTARTRALVRGSQLLGPIYPTFLDTRNALLQADRVLGRGDRDAIWEVFARRGMGFFSATSIDPGDNSPTEDFSLPPPPGRPLGTVTGSIREQESGRPIRRALIYFAGHIFTGGQDLGDRTDSKGRFRIKNVPAGTYPLMEVFRAGFDAGQFGPVKVEAGSNSFRLRLRRDWASLLGGARLRRATGDQFRDAPPENAFDQSEDGWISHSPNFPGDRGAKSVTVKLPRRVNVSGFAVDPGSMLGGVVDPTSSVAKFRIDVSRDGRRFTRSAQGAFSPDDNFQLNGVRARGKRREVRYVRFTMVIPQGPGGAHRFLEVAESYREFMGMTEFEVYGKPPRR